eukprot:gene14037-biopygen1016
MPQCHKSRNHEITKSRSHEVTKSRSHGVTESRSHEVTKSRSHGVTGSRGHGVTGSACHRVCVSACRRGSVATRKPDLLAHGVPGVRICGNGVASAYMIRGTPSQGCLGLLDDRITQFTVTREPGSLDKIMRDIVWPEARERLGPCLARRNVTQMQRLDGRWGNLGMTLEEPWEDVGRPWEKPWDNLGETLETRGRTLEAWGKLGIGRLWISGWPVQVLEVRVRTGWHAAQEHD